MRREKIVIIGAGPAGCAAAVQCKRLGIPPLLLDRNDRPGGLLRNAWRVENYPAVDPISGSDFVLKLQEHLGRFRINITKGEVSHLSCDSNEITLQVSMEEVKTSALILAVGTTAVPLLTSGADTIAGSSLFYEVEEIHTTCPNAKKVAILGGGEAAFDYALSVADWADEILVLVRSSEPQTRGDLRKWVENNPKITVVTDALLENIAKEEEATLLTCRHPTGEKTYRVNALLCAIGRQSAATPFLSSLGLKRKTSIATEDPRVFLVGDARTGTLGQAGIAVGDGLAAAMAAVKVVEK